MTALRRAACLSSFLLLTTPAPGALSAQDKSPSRVARGPGPPKSGRAAAVVEAVTSREKPGQIGDGKIFVTPLGQVVRIRTGETDGDAL